MKSEYLDWSGKLALNICSLVFKPFVRVENEERLDPRADSIVFAINHNNAIETLIVATSLIRRLGYRKVSFIVDWMFAQVPVLGWLISKIDPVFVYSKPPRFRFTRWLRRRFSLTETAVDECIQRLNFHRGLLGIYPEGKRNDCPEHLQRGRKGIGYIVLKTHARVVPVGIDFPARIHEKKIPAFGKTILRIGQEMSFAHEKSEFLRLNNDTGIDEPERRTQTNYLVLSVTDSIMREIARFSGKQYPYPKPCKPQSPAAMEEARAQEHLQVDCGSIGS